MLLLVALALAADPPADTPPPAPTPVVVSAETLRRACDTGQLCDGRCIPWTETCAPVLRAHVDVMKQEASDAQRQAILCGAADALVPPPPDLAAKSVDYADTFTLCAPDGLNELKNCKKDPSGRDLLPAAPTTRTPPCGEAPPAALATSPAPSAAPPR